MLEAKLEDFGAVVMEVVEGGIEELSKEVKKKFGQIVEGEIEMRYERAILVNGFPLRISLAVRRLEAQGQASPEEGEPKGKEA